MRPPRWHPPIELSTGEQASSKRIRRAKLCVCLRQHRHELFTAPFPQALATLSKDQAQGHPPVSPAPLALATLLQASTQVADDAGSDATTMDRRWQLVLDGRDGETPPLSTGTRVVFRQRLIAQQMDRRLLERTVESAARRGGFGPRQVRAALDRSPRWGAGRVAETDNLWGHALRKAVGVIARQQGRGLRAMAEEAGASLVAGPSSKAALALAWDAPSAQQHALPRRLDELQAVAHGLDTQPAPAAVAPQVAARLAGAEQGRTHDLTAAPKGTPTRRQGVAAERRSSVEDAARRQGRKSRSLLGDGSKRHGLCALDARLIVAVGVTPANAPEASVTDAIETDVAAHHCTRRAWHMDRASLASPLVQQRPATWAIVCQAWPVHQGPYCPTSACHLDGERHARQCPGGVTLPCEPGGSVQLPAATCAGGAWRPRCTTSASGRRVRMHPDEALLQEWRDRQQTPQGRAQLRERVAVAHALAHMDRWPGRRARYGGGRKKVFALRRCAVVHTLHVLMSLPETAWQAA
jgi:hypothetical protein